MNSRWLSQFKYLFLLMFVCFNTVSVFAGPARTTYQARIVKPDGYPLESANVNFKFTILDPVGTCALYSETYSNVSMASSSGLISFSLGTGIKTFPVSGTTFEQVFSNVTPFLACDTGGPANYSPGSNDIRKIVMQFNDGNGWQTLPAMSINAVPYAMYANDSQTLQGKQASDFVQVTTLPTCGASQAMHYNGSSFSCVAVGSGGGSVTSSTITTALGYTPADGASVTAINSSLSSSVAAANANISTVSSTVNSLANNLNSVSSTVSSLAGTVNSVSSTVSSLAATVNSVSAAVYSVSSTVSGLQATVTSLSNSVAASFASIVSSQWSTSGSTVYYNTGGVGIGTSNTGATQLYVTKDQDALTDIYLYNGNGGTGAGSRLGIAAASAQMFLAAYSASSTSFGGETANDALMYSGTGSRDLGFSSRSVSGSIKFYTGGNPNVTRRRMTIDWLGNVGIGTSTPVARLDVSGGVRIGTDTTSCSSVNAGTLRYNAGVVEYCNGTSWAAFGVSGAGIMALNGLTSGSQTIAFGTSGTLPNVSSTGTTHTFNFPMAATGGVTAGLISNSDYTTFTNKADSASLTSLTNTAAASYTSLNSNLNAVSSSLTSLSNAAGTSYSTLNSNINSVSSSLTSLTNTAAASYAGTMVSINSVSSTLNNLSNTAAASYTTLNANLNSISATVAAHTASLTALAAAVSSGVGSQWVTSGSTISYNNGNVGIGTTNPAFKLAVSGSTYIKGPITLGNTPPTGGSFDVGPLLGGVVGYNSPFFQQDTLTDFSNPFTFGRGNSIKFDSSANTTSTAMGNFQFTQNVGTNNKDYQSLVGDYVITQNDGTGFMGQVAANAALAIQNNSSGSVSTLFGVYGRAYNFGGNVAQQIGGYFGSAQQMTGFTTQNYGVLIDSAVGTVGTNYGLYISDQNFVTASQTYNIYSAGSATNNYFGGFIGLGVNIPSARLHITGGSSTYAPLKLASGVLTASPTSGAIEYDGANFYLTDGTNTRRAIVTVTSAGTINNTSNFNSTGNISMTPSGSVVVSTTTTSTSSQTGALIVKGGLGVGENLNVGGALNVTGIISGSSQIKATGYRASQGAPNNNDSSTNGYSFGADGDTGLFSPGSGAANGILTLYANNAERLRIDGGGIGIGTGTPFYPLQVQKTSVASAAIMIGGAFAGGPRIQTYGLDADPLGFMGLGTDMAGGPYESSVYFPVGPTTNGKVTFGSYNGTTYSEKMRINAAGNVGIGTANPGAKLHINGNQALENNVVGTGASSIAFWKNRNYGATLNADELGYISFYGHDGSSTLRSAYIISNGDGTPMTGSVPGNLRFFTTNLGAADSSERMRITASGSVGIGTTTPLAKLTVTNNTSTPLSSSIAASAHLFHVLGADGQAARILVDTYSNGVSQTPMLQLRNSQGTAASPSPTIAGDSIGSVRFTGNMATAGSYTGSFGAGIDAYSTATWTSAVGGQPSYMTFSTAGNGSNITERMRLDQYGNFMIGATSAATMVQVGQPFTGVINGWSVSRTKGIMIGDDTDNVYFGLENQGTNEKYGTVIWGDDGTEPFLFQTNDSAGTVTERMRITGNGRVGIGISNPLNTLTVSNTQVFNPNTNVSSAIMVGPPAGQNFGGGILMKDFTYYGGMWMNGSGAILSFGAGATASGFPSVNVLNVTSQAVGVGTSSPSEKLEVSGNLKVSGEIYGTKSWGFKKGPTAFVANYIHSYGAGYHVGTSIDCTSSANGCTILKAGTYEIHCTQRGGTTTSTFVGIALNGDRTALESRADAMWEHDHTTTPGGFTKSNFLGTLSAGNFITCGAANSTTQADLTFGAASYNGTLSIKRID